MCDGKSDWIGWDMVRNDKTGASGIPGESENEKRVIDFYVERGRV